MSVCVCVCVCGGGGQDFLITVPSAWPSSILCGGGGKLVVAAAMAALEKENYYRPRFLCPVRDMRVHACV